MTPSVVLLVTLIVYKLTLITIGILSQRRVQDGVDYFLAGRKLGPLVAAISAAASSSSAWTLLGVSGAAYQWGLSAIWLFPGCLGGFLINWMVLAGPLRKLSYKTGALTVTEILAGPADRAYHKLISRTASIILLIFMGSYVASQFHGAGKTFSETFGLSSTHSILLGSGVVVLYTLIGGFWAVSLTDTIQGLVMALASLILPLTVLYEVGGITEFFSGMAQVQQSGYWSLTRELPLVLALGVISGYLGIGLGYPGQPHVVNRFMALSQGAKVLRRSQIIAVAWALIVFPGMLVLGWCGRLLFVGLPDPEVVFVTATTQLFPPVVAAVLLAAVLSAIMSTADSQLLVAASSVTHDLKLGGRGSASLLARSRLVVLALSAGAIVLALYGNQEIFSAVLFAFTSLGAAFGPVLLITALSGPVAPGATLASMLLGCTLSVLFYQIPATQGTGVERALPILVSFVIAIWGRRRMNRMGT